MSARRGRMTGYGAQAQDETPQALLRRGIRISSTSLAWTLLGGISAVVIGAGNHSVVLIAFGLTGTLDGAGSLALILSFRHSQRSGELSALGERIAGAVVTVGLVMVGAATAAAGVARLAGGTGARSTGAGITLAGVSTVVLVMLAIRKVALAADLGSRALHRDGILSAVGAALAAVTLAGTALTSAFGWWWSDPAAGLVLAALVVSTAVRAWRPPATVHPPVP